jgi:hypothetical protein
MLSAAPFGFVALDELVGDLAEGLFGALGLPLAFDLALSVGDGVSAKGDSLAAFRREFARCRERDGFETAETHFPQAPILAKQEGPTPCTARIDNEIEARAVGVAARFREGSNLAVAEFVYRVCHFAPQR